MNSQFVKMPDRKSNKKTKDTNSTNTLRRSPRFMQEQNPKTPELKKTRFFRFISTPPTFSIIKSHKKCEANSAKDGKKTRPSSNISLNSSKGFEKRVTRSSKTDSKCGFDLDEGSCKKSSHFSKLGKDKALVSRNKQCVGNVEKRGTRSSNRKNINQLDNGLKKVESDEIKVKKVVELSTTGDEKECGSENGNGNGNDKCTRRARIGEKRKRGEIDKESKSVRGWTDEQEAALRRAYFTAKPTPHFWKKVSKMVPGKSAEECFERIHSDHRTPPQPCTRSTAKQKPSSLSLSNSSLLSSTNTKPKRVRSTKQNCLLAQKTVRQLLEKQNMQEKDHQADLFSILEPTVDPCSLNFGDVTLFSSPSPELGSRSLSSSANKKQSSRLSVSNNAAFISPPVLKQVKNKALHEKYIDQLHYRNAKRKKESLRNGKRSRAIDETETNCVEKKSVKFAKDTLLFEAQDAISQFQNLQTCVEDDMNDDEDNSCQSNEDEEEDLL